MVRRFLALLILCSAFAVISPAAELVVPGVANLSGGNGTHFSSDVTLTNLTAATATVSIGLIGTPGSAAVQTKTIALAPYASVSYDNALAALWNLNESGGALRITSDVPVAVRARTFNTTAGGTFGLSLPTFDASSFISAQNTGVAPWVSQSPDVTTGFRTNVGVVFPDTDGGSATVIVLGARGEELGRKTYDATSAAFIQEPVRNIAAVGEVARVTLAVARGRAQAYTSVVDNVTGDASVFSVNPSFGNPVDAIVGGVAHTPGANGTFFTTDMRVVNPTGSTATVRVAYLEPASDNSAPVTTTLTLLPLETREIKDVLGTLFALPDGSAGALRITSQTAILVAARTSNINPNGAAGTYGSQQQTVALTDFSSSTSTLSAIVQDDAARTNAGFVAAAEGATLSLTLRGANGGPLATTTMTLPPFAWVQQNVATLFGLSHIDRGATLELTPLSGRVSAYSSIVDQHSGDAAVANAVAAGCAASASVVAPATSCRTSNVTFTASDIAGATYGWSVSGGTILSGAGSRSIVVAPQSFATVTATAEINAGGCIARVSKPVTIVDSVSIASVATQGTTVGKEVLVTWNIVGSPERIEISGTDFVQPLSMDLSARSYSYVPATAGAKTVTVKVTNACGSSSSVKSYTIAAPSNERGSGGSGGAYPGLQTFAGASGRDYVVYVPASYDPSTPIPVVFALGGQGEPYTMVLQRAWQSIADRDNVLIVTFTPASTGPGYYGAYDVPEFETIEKMESEVPQRYNVSLQRMYYWGFSAGAHVTYMFALTAERSNRIAAFAVHAGALEAAATRVNPPSWPPQAGARRLPAHLSCGLQDQLLVSMRSNRDAMIAQGYPVQYREVSAEGHDYRESDVRIAWDFLKAQKLP